MTITAESLTGEWVMEFRKRHKLSRDGLMREGGFEGKSGARIQNIEVKNSWKAGDRERIVDVVRRLEPESVAELSYDGGTYGQQVVPDDVTDSSEAAEFWAVVDALDDDYIDRNADVQDELDTPLPDDEHAAAADAGCEDECEPQPAAVDGPPPVASPSSNGGPLPVADPGGLQLPRGWEHLYPPADPRHQHRFEGDDVACANVSCDYVDPNVPPVVAEPSAAAKLLAAQPAASGFGKPVLILPDDGIKSLTQSELARWRRCRRAWMLAIYRQLRPRQESMTDARATGDRVHRALAAWYHPDPAQRVDPRDALERVIVEDWTKIHQAALAAGMDEAWVATKADEFATVNTLERIMIEGYVQWLEETGADAGYQVISAEEAVSVLVDVPGTGKQVRLLGKFDVRLLRKSDGARLFVDHKTTGDMKSVLPTLRGNPQMLHYEVIEWLVKGENDVVDGALYNMLRKVKRTVRATPPFYDRVEVRHNHFELEAYLQQTLAAAREIDAATAALAAGYSHQVVTPPTKTPECRFCDFKGVCDMFDDGSRVEDAIVETFTTGDPLARYASEITIQRPDGTIIA